MELTFPAEKASIETKSYSSDIEITVAGVLVSDLFEAMGGEESVLEDISTDCLLNYMKHLDLNTIISKIGIDTILENIGIEKVKEYFGIKDNEIVEE